MKPRTKKDIENDPRIEKIERTFAPECPWIASTNYPYMFHANSRSVQGTIKEICEDMDSLVDFHEMWYE